MAADNFAADDPNRIFRTYISFLFYDKFNFVIVSRSYFQSFYLYVLIYVCNFNMLCK
jgi:hypothetical protein